MPELVQLSDLHFGPPFLPDRARAARELTRRLAPDFVVVSGDFTQRARRAQFEQAAEYLKSFEVPVVVTPGNHDLPLFRVLERLFAPYRNYRRYISGELDSAHRFPGAVVVALNSTRPVSITNGKIHASQLDFAARAFDDVPEDAFRIVVTHHHLAPPPDFAGGEVMPGARRALSRFIDLGVQLVLAGHMHRSYIGDSLDFFPGSDRESGIVIAQCGTTTSARGRGRERLKNSLNYIRKEGPEITIRHYLWRGPERGFWAHSEHRFGASPSVWLERAEAPPERRAARG